MKSILLGLKNDQQNLNAIRIAIELAKKYNSKIKNVIIENDTNLTPYLVSSTGMTKSAIDYQTKNLSQNKTLSSTIIDNINQLYQGTDVSFSILDKNHSLIDLIKLSHQSDLLILNYDLREDYTDTSSSIQNFLSSLNDLSTPIIYISPENKRNNNIFISIDESIESLNTLKRFMHLDLYRDHDFYLLSFYVNSKISDRILTYAEEYLKIYNIFPTIYSYPYTNPKSPSKVFSLLDIDLLIVNNKQTHIIKTEVNNRKTSIFIY